MESKLFEELVELQPELEMLSLKTENLQLSLFQNLSKKVQSGAENLQASESRIRDTDMAAEMVEFTKDQVLSQAGTAMLAQANQSSQNVLSLLR